MSIVLTYQLENHLNVEMDGVRTLRPCGTILPQSYNVNEKNGINGAVRWRPEYGSSG